MSAARLSRLLLTASIAVFFSLAALGNITNYGSNFAFVQHVLAMDTTFQDPALMWRAITTPALHHAAYGLIIAWEAMTAALLWRAVGLMWRSCCAPVAEWRRGRDAALIGLTAGMLLYGLGFLCIAGEWFAMWQSKQWNGQQTAGIFLVFIGVVLLHVAGDQEQDGANNAA
jgi:predicted small integral membrane protein